MPKKRAVKKRSLRPILHIYCEGSKTEPNYIDYYIKTHCESFRQIQTERIKPERIKLSDLVDIPPTGKTDPKSLVNLAIEGKTRNPKGDEFWCVYDRESEAAIPEAVHREAFAAARKEHIHIAFSNVCFEVWLLLHRQSTCAAYCSYEDLERRSELKTYFKDYAKGDKRKFLKEEIDLARKRAPAMNQRTRAGEKQDCPVYRLNPYSDFHTLLDAIDSFFAKNAKIACR